MTTENTRLYELFELTPQATPAQLRESYLKTKELFEPSHTAVETLYTPEERAQILKKIEEAYALLTHKQPRSSPLPDSPKTPNPLQFKAPSPRVPSNTAIEPQKRTRNEHSEEPWSGERIHNRRLHLGLTLEELSKRTKLKKPYLMAIEAEDFANLPAAVYVRGFVTQIAKALSLPSEEVTCAYFKRYQEKLGFPKE